MNDRKTKLNNMNYGNIIWIYTYAYIKTFLKQNENLIIITNDGKNNKYISAKRIMKKTFTSNIIKEHKTDMFWCGF